MKKLLVFVLVAILMATTCAQALACGNRPLAVNDGGSNESSGNTTTNQVGGVNQSATVNGSGNAVDIRQYVGGGDTHYHYYTIVQEPTSTSEEENNVDWDAVRNRTAVFAIAFLNHLRTELLASGWSMFYSMERQATHNYVVRVQFTRSDNSFSVGGGYLQYYTADLVEFRVALSTSLHCGWRISEYPPTELVFGAGQTEAEFVANLLAWLAVSYQMNGSAAVSLSATCGCCANCACNGGCHPGCGCGCLADLASASTADTAAAELGGI